jgi:hypothetical protein
MNAKCAELALIGTEGEAEAQLGALTAVGITDFAANISAVGRQPDPTWEFLSAQAAGSRPMQRSPAQRG